MTRSLAATLSVLVLTLACSSSGTASDDGKTTTTQGATESGEPSNPSTSTTDPSETDETEETEETDAPEETNEGGFVPDEDIYGICSLDELSLCDEFAQDCPEGEKCVPHFGECAYPRCVPITSDKPAGSPCTVDPRSSDDCDADSWCYPGTLDLEQPGICISFCQGTADDSSCEDPSQVCMADELVYDWYIGCRPSCDPLMPAGCEPYERCTVVDDAQAQFGCVMGGGVADGDVCKSNQDCDSGACVLAEQLLECAGDSCCAPWCDLMAPSCAMGLECVPVEIGDPNSTVGVCALP